MNPKFGALILCLKTNPASFKTFSALPIGFIVSLNVITLFWNLPQDAFSLECLRKIKLHLTENHSAFSLSTYIWKKLAEWWMQTTTKKYYRKLETRWRFFFCSEQKKPWLSSQLSSNLEIAEQDEPSPSLVLLVLSQPLSGQRESHGGTGGQESLSREVT